jgi:hypothetical protein
VSDESDFEPVPGLPEVLPQGERMLWQGAPRPWALALTAFRVRAVAWYFAALMGWRFFTTLVDGGTLRAALEHAITLAPLAAGALAILSLIAYLSARTTMYTITDRRIVMRYGMALPLTMNIPFNSIEAASVTHHKDGTGDIALAVRDEERIGYLILWPHARPWRYAKPEPSLRGLSDPDAVAGLLAQALASHAGLQSAPASMTSSTNTAPVQGSTVAAS